MKPMYIKLIMVAGLFIAWVLLVAFQVQGAGDLIEFIKIALQGIGLYHAAQWGNEPLPLIEGHAAILGAEPATAARQPSSGTTVPPSVAPPPPPAQQ